MRAPALARSAVVVVAAEGLALLVVALIEVVRLTSGDVASVTSGIALITLTAIGALALLAFAVGTAVGRSWARSGAVVLQVIAVVLAIASLTIPPIAWSFVLGVGLPALVAGVLLIASARSEAAPRRGEAPDDPPAGS